MKRKLRRGLFVAVSLLAIVFVLAFVFLELRKSISFFCTTTELMTNPEMSSRSPVRVGGMVVKGSIKYNDDCVMFSITDFNNDLQVVYSGVLPPLFGEDMGAIAKGSLKNGIFVAEELLAKHDETYMPKKDAHNKATLK
ncbi:MAG: cytochrome c maturation protein CcmE [Aaplasma endosymbiont of Hyalomma asiaticum]